MGKTPFHRRTWHAARTMVVLTTVFAMVVAPLVVILTHGPAAHEVAASMTVDMAEKVAAQGHAHDEAPHDHQNGHQSGPLGGHNPADHDHQLHALVCRADSAPKPLPGQARCAFSEGFRHLTPESPRRPPRLV